MYSTAQRSPGERLGSHELVRPIGVGGMGEVWEAVLHGPAGFVKPVAIKLLHAGPSEREQAMLVREARLGARLQHPNVVSVLGLGEVGGVWYVVMELVRGCSSAELLAKRFLAPSEVLDIGVQAAAGLAHIHGLVVDDRPSGLVHCDVKPENLLVEESGLVKVADLGIAALVGERRNTGGTLGFMAPEQLDGAPERRSDLFALGATLYFLATRQRPFERAVRGLMGLERRLDQPDFVAPVDAAVPGLGAVVRRCLRSDPADRWSSATELCHELARLRVAAAPTPTAAAASGPPLFTPTAAPATTLAGTGSAPTGNLQRPRDRFVGRSADLAALSGALRAGERLVTLVATGGTGKTRLAIEAALDLGRDYVGGAWFLPLEAARTPEEVCAAIAGQLGSVLTPGSDTAVQVGAALAGRRSALFVLDNAEQCVDAVRALLPRWMAVASEAAFLITSRVPLKLRGERTADLGALPPDDAVALFRERAPQRVPAEQTDAVRELCAALEHVPLAIELAAARLRSMSITQMSSRLGFELLAGGAADLPERQRSIEASIRWSWDLLPESAQHALAQLSVFAGGFTLAAAEAVLDERATGGGWALDVVQALCEASLVRLDPESERFGTLALVRAFASARLGPADRAAAEARHAAFFAQLGAHGAIERLRFPVVLPDLDNVVAAIRSATRRGDAGVLAPLVLACTLLLDRVGPHELAVELVDGALTVPGLADRDRVRIAVSAARSELVVGRASRAEGYLAAAREGVARSPDPALEGALLGVEALRLRLAGRPAEAAAAYQQAIDALAPGSEPHALARLLSGRGGLAHEAGLADEARGWFERSLRMRRAAGDRHGEAMDRANLANVAAHRGRHGEALAHQQASLALYREVADRRGEAQITGDIGLSLHHLGRAEEAERYLRAALALHRRSGNRRFEGIVLSNLGLHLTDAGRFDEAAQQLEAALDVHREVGNRRSEGVATHQLARLHLRAGRPEPALALVREAQARHAAVGNRLWAATSLELAADILVALDRRGEARAELEWAAAAFAAIGEVERGAEVAAKAAGIRA